MREPPVSRFISRATPQAASDLPAEPRVVAGRPPVARPAGAQQPREMDAALFNLSEPAHPRDASPAETASFVPASHVSAYAQQPEAAPVLDDFDRLIASEMAAMGAGASAAQGGPVNAAFSDYDIAFTHNGAAATSADPAYEPAGADDADPMYDDPPAAGGAPMARRRGRPHAPVAVGGGVKRGVTFVSGVAGVALISIAAAVAWNSLFGGGVGSGEPLVIAADTQPYKTRPEDPGGREIPNQNKAVYQRATGQGAQAPTQESLIASDEEPVDISADDAFELPGVAIGQSQIPLNEGDLDARMAALAGDGGEAAAAPEAVTGVLEPRRVRTVEVRPDGTIVGAAAPAADTSVGAEAGAASGAPAPVEQDPMAALIASATAERDALASGQVSLPTSMPAAQALPAEAPAAESLPPEVSVVPTPAPARPAASPGPSASAASTVTALAPEPRPAPMPAAATGSGFYVQLSAQPSEEQARQALRDASLRYANILSGSRLSIQSAAVENRGTFYRVRAEAPSYAQAEQVCSRLQRAGAECFVTR